MADGSIVAGTSLLDRVHEVFGPSALAEALFYRHSPALRFELEGGETRIAQFLQAMDRARAVLHVAFAGTEELTVVLEVWTDQQPAHLISADQALAKDGSCAA